MNYGLFLNDILNYADFSNCNSLYSSAYSNLEKEEDTYVFRSDAMGLEQSDITIDVKDSILEITSNSEKSGRFTSSINRKIKVGSKIDINNISANLKNGVLEVRMPMKEEHSVSRRIQVL